MKPIKISRPIIVLLPILILAVFLAGTLRTFSPARAAFFSENGPTPTPLPSLIVTSADTTGIIALAILVVVVTLVGMVWGGAISPRKKITRK
jgi:hypothetical protein